MPLGFFHRRMESQGLILLFDGLDETGTAARRSEIVELITAFAENLSAKSRVIVTSRPHDYRHRFNYPHYDLCEFDDTEIQSCIQGCGRSMNRTRQRP